MSKVNRLAAFFVVGCTNATTPISGAGADSVTIAEFGLSARLQGADMRKSACTRLVARVEKLKSIDVGAPGLADKIATVKSAIGNATSEMGEFEPLLNGEVRNSYAGFVAGDGFNAIELQLLLVDLANHLRAAGISDEKVDAIVAALQDAAVTARQAAVRDKVASIAVDIGDFFALLQRCAPKK